MEEPFSPIALEERLKELDRRLLELEANLAGLRGPHLEVVEKAISPTGEQVEGPHLELVREERPLAQEEFEEWRTGRPGSRPEEYISALGGSPGIVLKPGLARATPCLRLEVGEGQKPLVYSPGIIGPLDEEEQALYCTEGYVEEEASERLKARRRIFAAAARRCSQETEGLAGIQRLEPYLSCLEKEAAK